MVCVFCRPEGSRCLRALPAKLKFEKWAIRESPYDVQEEKMNIAIVTGASSGMGREFVLQLNQYVKVEEIWVIARRTQALEELKKEVSVPLRPISLDLCAKESFKALAELLKKEQPDVKLLVNAAGFGKFGTAVNIPVEEDCRMIDLIC